MKRLSLRSEYLRELSSTELASVAAADGLLTGIYPTLNTPCNTDLVCIEVAQLPTRDCFTGTPAPTLFC
ncbi:MAG TPA: hypothetical protein VGX28_05630 [Frankiaceae bacterium]|jgi:hypothetical protein|nr:hypothetical protein [Frankiaceae bacterium]